MPEGNPRFGKIVGGHLDVNLIAHADADEVFAHLAGNMREDLMTVREGYTKHCARQDLRNRAHQFNWFFFSHVNRF